MLAQAVQINANDGLAHYYLGNVLEAQQDSHSALEQYQLAAKLIPDFLPLQSRLGLLAQRVGFGLLL